MLRTRRLGVRSRKPFGNHVFDPALNLWRHLVVRRRTERVEQIAVVGKDDPAMPVTRARVAMLTAMRSVVGT